MRGELVDIGGRRLRAVRAGPPKARPLIVCEHGAFGCASDWAVVQDKLAARGLRSLAYDRAGLGHSDPGPSPRDGEAMARDLEALLAALGEAGPFLLVGHSMGGLMMRIFALRHPEQVVGLVLVDAMTPDIVRLPAGAAAVRNFGRLLKLASAGAKLGLMVPVSQVSGNLIGLPGEAGAEKRRIHASAKHAKWAADEVSRWPEISALADHPLPPRLPVAVVTAGAFRGANPVKRVQEAPARRSDRGYVDHVAGCNHANLLGPRYADAILRGIDHVLDDAGLGALAGDQSRRGAEPLAH
jgi:pimeloyl-ACP methyl ester carboxylesterase